MKNYGIIVLTNGGNMRQEKAHKIKLLKLWEILKRETDSEHRLSTRELLDKLAGEGIECDRRTLYDDIKVLNEYGYEIMQDRSRANLYYVEDRNFDIPELKILIDSVEASSFITKKKSRELISKIASLGGSHRAELLKKYSIEYNTKKHNNENIYYSVMAIGEAIDKKRKIRFQYYDTDVLKNKVLRKDGNYYIVNPCCMVYDNNNYYLVCYDDKHRQLSHYRIDRMLNAEVCTDKIDNYPNLKNSDIRNHINQLFGMYTGEKTKVKIRADNSLVDVVQDKFGDVNSFKYDNDNFVFYADVQLSPMFYSWCFSLGSKIAIIEPASAVESYRERLRVAFESIKE